MSRKSTGKRLRFEVFKRDNFTCQYCGAQPPDVVLVADHIAPVALSGSTSIDNLITACESCNQGKADRPIHTRQVRPDADLLYLETQQEIAELRRYQQARGEREQLLNEVVESIQDDFQDASGTDWAPDDHIIRSLLERYEPALIERAVRVVGYLIRDRKLSTSGNRWVAYLNGVARNMAEQEVEE